MPDDPPPGKQAPEGPTYAERIAAQAERIAVLPGDPPVAYRPGAVIVRSKPGQQDVVDELREFAGNPEREGNDVTIEPLPSPIGDWYVVRGVRDAPKTVRKLLRAGFDAQLDVVYFANECGRTMCPPHPALASAMAATPWTAHPWTAHPWTAHPWTAHPWTAHPWTAHPEALNVVATGKPPMSSAMPALANSERKFPKRQPLGGAADVVIGVLDSGLALPLTDPLSPPKVSTPDPTDLASDVMGGEPADGYLDPVAGHGTFIAGIVEQLTPGCTIRVHDVFEPEGDVSTSKLVPALDSMMAHFGAVKYPKTIVNLSFGGTRPKGVFDKDVDLFEQCLEVYADEDVVFVAAAGNEGSCVEQYPAALPFVIGVAALGPTGPAPWSNYGCWVDACAPGTDLVSSFFDFDGDLPEINGVDADDFEGWATWSGTSFAAPVVVAALAREMAINGWDATEAVEHVIRAPHLARLPNMGTIVNL